MSDAADRHGSSAWDFDRDGFVILRQVFDPELLRTTRELLVDVVRYAEKNLADPFTAHYLRHRADQGVLYDLYQRHPELAPLVRHPRVLDALVPALGEDIFLYENSVVYKPKGRKNGVPFHQDFISRPNEPIKYIAWMAIDRVTRESGALKVLPGTHKTGFRKWHRVPGEAHHDRIDTASLDLSGQVHLELEPGDVLLFNQLVIHGSDEMHTDSLRLVYRASYQGFDEIYVPRGSPVVMRGGHPRALAARWPQTEPERKRKPLVLRAINYVGRKLASI